MVEPESEEMKTRVRMLRGVEGKVGERGEVRREVGEPGLGVERDRSVCAVMRGPMVLVWRWWAKSLKDLGGMLV